MDAFIQDVDEGLSAPQKFLSSKYFYDDQGSRIFQQIMHMPEYYPTDCEFEILSSQGEEILKATKFSRHFNIIELGAGDGLKTVELLKGFLAAGAKFTYVPIDISQGALEDLEDNLKKKVPALSIDPKVGDYFEVLSEISHSKTPSLLLFLGSNIGNYLPEKAKELLKLFHANMKAGDKLLLGADLQKDPAIIAKAYNDSQGYTRDFNLNLLRRINRELGGNFQLPCFEFYSYYNPILGEVRSFLISKKDQDVYIEAIDKTYSFKQHEWIYTELSKKYSFEELDALANISGFSLQKNFLDSKNYFVDSLWEKVA